MSKNEASEAKKSKKTKGSTAPYEAAVEESADLSSIFFSHYNTATLPLENKKSAGIIENFTILFQRLLSTFLGRKIELHFDNMKICELKELHIEKKPVILSSILFAPHNQSGLIFYDYSFMHYVIDILYGAGNYKNNTIISTLGRSGHTIAKKVTEICISALQEAISEYEKIQISALKTTEQHGLILNQPLAEQFFNLSFSADFNDAKCQFNIAIPDELFEELTLQESAPAIEHKDTTTVNHSLKNDIIDSTVVLVASLQDIKLKITDIMNLKTGDLIPIQDPTIVYMAHNQKKIFKGSVGQSNSLRVVKILDTL